MSVIFFKRFLQRPMQVASIIPSSKPLIRKIASKFDFSQPRIIAEFGPGEGCQTRELLKQMHPESRLLLFELDPEFAKHLELQFRGDPRVEVIHSDAANLLDELAKRDIPHCDYVLSGIPFSIMQPTKKRELLQKIFDALAPTPTAAFIIYQYTNELIRHCKHFPRHEADHCKINIPPTHIICFYKQALPSAVAANEKKSLSRAR